MSDWPNALLRLFAFDACDQLWWREDNGALTFHIRCNDVFWWGTSDLEQVQPADLPDLERAQADAPDDWALLWAARKRRMRPQGAYYGHLSAGERHLFDEAGPPRETSLTNPIGAR